MRRPELTIAQILTWVDAYFASTGRWPNRHSGRIAGSLGETWMAVHMALGTGGRGLSPPGRSLPQLLAEERGVPNRLRLPRLSEKQVLDWAQTHRRRTGMWPTNLSGKIPESTVGDTWHAIDKSLRHGRRGLAGGSSLFRLLAKVHAIGVHRRRPPFSIPEILQWAEAHHARTGRWPTKWLGSIAESPETSWRMVDAALRNGNRGLPGGSSLLMLLKTQRGVRPTRRDLLSTKQILDWARAYRRRFGRNPSLHAGRIPRQGRLTWLAVDMALRKGLRGLPGGSSLSRLLAAPRHRRPTRR